jgi:3'(2'), 5'-bisphosphate nucleotidase
MDGHLQKELDLACTAVQLCASLTQRLQRETLRPESALSKSDYSPVTIGDFAVQALLTSAIHARFPEDKFLAEESADDLRKNPRLLEEVWTLIEEMKPNFAEIQPALALPTSASQAIVSN